MRHTQADKHPFTAHRGRRAPGLGLLLALALSFSPLAAPATPGNLPTTEPAAASPSGLRIAQSEEAEKAPSAIEPPSATEAETSFRPESVPTAEHGQDGERIVADLDQNRVAITAGFDGSEIFVFGAVKRTAPEPETGPLAVIVTLSGPPEKVIVRKKDRVKGIWINTEHLVVEAAPSFYALATSGPLREILDEDELLRYRIGIRQRIFSLEGIARREEAEPFIDALIRLQQKRGVYRILEGAVKVSEATLFHTRIPLPANLTEGEYEADIYLARGGRIIDRASTTIPVRKIGLERWVWRLAHERPLLYGILAVALAALTGWLASAVFALLRR